MADRVKEILREFAALADAGEDAVARAADAIDDFYTADRSEPQSEKASDFKVDGPMTEESALSLANQLRQPVCFRRLPSGEHYRVEPE